MYLQISKQNDIGGSELLFRLGNKQPTEASITESRSSTSEYSVDVSPINSDPEAPRDDADSADSESMKPTGCYKSCFRNCCKKRPEKLGNREDSSTHLNSKQNDIGNNESLFRLESATKLPATSGAGSCSFWPKCSLCISRINSDPTKPIGCCKSCSLYNTFRKWMSPAAVEIVLMHKPAVGHTMKEWFLQWKPGVGHLKKDRLKQLGLIRSTQEAKQNILEFAPLDQIPEIQSDLLEQLGLNRLNREVKKQKRATFKRDVKSQVKQLVDISEKCEKSLIAIQNDATQQLRSSGQSQDSLESYLKKMSDSLQASFHKQLQREVRKLRQQTGQLQQEQIKQKAEQQKIKDEILAALKNTDGKKALSQPSAAKK